MQKYTITHYYDYFIDTVTYLLMDSEVPLYDLMELPNVSSNKPIENRDEGDKKIIKNEWCVHGQLPKIAQKIIKPDMLTFLEDSVWDRKTRVYSAKIIPHHFKKQFDAHHRVEFYDNNDGRTRRVLKGVFEAKIPIIGPIFELAILKYLKENAESDFKISSISLTKYIEKNGDPNADKSFKKHK
jgi:hypothetical protein